jgi:phage gpG-like protein
MVAAEAKRVIGEGYSDWPALKPETLARKFYNTPLLETGELRDSITHSVEGNEARVGSSLDKALFQEMGTSRIPAAAFLARSRATQAAGDHARDRPHRL